MNDTTVGWPDLVRSAICYLNMALGTNPLPLWQGDGRFSKKTAYAMRGVIPYCLEPLREQGQYIWLNREYKPLGILPYNDWVDYESFPLHRISLDEIMSFRPEKAVPNSWSSVKRLTQQHDLFFFYSDTTAFYHSKKDTVRLRDELQTILRGGLR